MMNKLKMKHRKIPKTYATDMEAEVAAALAAAAEDAKLEQERLDGEAVSTGDDETEFLSMNSCEESEEAAPPLTPSVSDEEINTKEPTGSTSTDEGEEADDDAFAMDEASLLDVMEPMPGMPPPCPHKKMEQQQERLKSIVDLCQNIRQRLTDISDQLQEKTAELDLKIQAKKKERDLHKKINNM
ncbi:hypothetical protein KR018_006495 [Drosophila ironensis]|nr:hypothetical protein KR018_006495 [Drosophila ironensis]